MVTTSRNASSAAGDRHKDNLCQRASRATTELRLCSVKHWRWNLTCAQVNEDQDKRTQSQDCPCPAPKVAPQACLQLAEALELAVIILKQIDAVHALIKDAQGAACNSQFGKGFP